LHFSGSERDGMFAAGRKLAQARKGRIPYESKRSPLSCRESFPGSDPFSNELTTECLLNLYKGFLSLLGPRRRSSRMLLRLPQAFSRSFHPGVRLLECTLHLLDFELGFADASRESISLAFQEVNALFCRR